MAVYNVSSGAELASALSSATGGDEIVLANGSYGDLTLSRDFPADVTIRAANPQAASFSSASITGSNVRIEDVTVTGRIKVTGANDIAIAGSDLRGFTLVQKTDGFGFDDNRIGGDSHGLFLEDTANFVVTDNYFYDVESDLMRVDGNSFNGLIENNVMRDMKPVRFPDGTTTHADALQMFGRAWGDPHDIVIRGNYIYDDPNTGATGNLWGQGIFLGGPVGSYSNILIEENLVAIGSPNSIFVTNGGSGVTIRDNTVLSWAPGSGGGTIRLEGNSGGTVVSDNVALSIMNNGGANIGDNFVYSNDPNASNYWGNIFQNGADGSSWEGFLPKPGSPIDFGSPYGAQDKLTSLLNGTPLPSTSDPAPPPDDTTTDAQVTAQDDFFSLDEDTLFNFTPSDLTGNDSADGGSAVTVESTTDPAHGTLTRSTDGTFTYDPDPDFTGTDSFRYTASDGAGGTDEAVVTLEVQAVSDDAPVAKDDAVSVRSDTAKSFNVLGNDSDPDGDPLAVTDFSQPAHGSVVDNGGGSFTYTPDAGFVGTDSFGYTLEDGTGRSSTATVNLTVSSLSAPALEVGSSTFDGTTRSAVIEPHDAAYETSEGTLAMTFTADETSGLQALMTKDASGYGAGGHFGVFLDGTGIRIRMQDGDSQTDQTIGGVVTAGAEHDLAVSFGGGGIDVYLDGERIGGDDGWTSGLEGNKEPVVLGANQWASSAGTADSLQNPFDGTIAETALYTTALSAEEIAALAGAQEPADPPADDPSDDATDGTSDGGTDGTGDTQSGETDDSSGGTTTDGSGSTPDGSGSTTPIFSLPGPTQFDGSVNDIVSVAHSNAFLVQEGSIAFDFAADRTGPRQGLLSKDAYGYLGGGNHLSAYLDGDDLKVRLQDAGSETILAADIVAGTTHSVLVTFEAGRVQLYLDGALVAADDFTMDWTDNVQALQVGGLGWASASGDDAASNPLDGTMSDVAIFDAVLNPSDIDLL